MVAEQLLRQRLELLGRVERATDGNRPGGRPNRPALDPARAASPFLAGEGAQASKQGSRRVSAAEEFGKMILYSFWILSSECSPSVHGAGSFGNRTGSIVSPRGMYCSRPGRGNLCSWRRCILSDFRLCLQGSCRQVRNGRNDSPSGMSSLSFPHHPCKNGGRWRKARPHRLPYGVSD